MKKILLAWMALLAVCLSALEKQPLEIYRAARSINWGRLAEKTFAQAMVIRC